MYIGDEISLIFLKKSDYGFFSVTMNDQVYGFCPVVMVSMTDT